MEMLGVRRKVAWERRSRRRPALRPPEGTERPATRSRRAVSLRQRSRRDHRAGC